MTDPRANFDLWRHHDPQYVIPKAPFLLPAWRAAMTEIILESFPIEPARSAFLADVDEIKTWNLFALANTIVRRGRADPTHIIAISKLIFDTSGGNP